MTEDDYTKPFAVLLGDTELKDPVWWCRFYKEATFIVLSRMRQICDGDEVTKEIACAQFEDFVRGCNLTEYMKLSEVKNE